MRGELEQGQPCKVCGCTDLSLIDGFYYCIECGTQDTNVRQTIVQRLVLPDGTYEKARSVKIKKIDQAVDTVSPEWHKWHCYNYIIAGMADEVVSLGADPSFKTKALWLWSLYMKKFQNRQELGLPVDEDDDQDESSEDLSTINKINPKRKRRSNRKAYNVAEISNVLFFTILYLALNFDKSDLQLTHLIRFVQERRLSFANCVKLVPKDINVQLIDNFSHLCSRAPQPTIHYTRVSAMTFIKTFKLGPPVLPDLKKIVDRFITELCLPDDFQKIVYSLMQLVPCDYFVLDKFIMSKMVRIPFYECIVMSYVIVGLKMCFGLDDDYEIKLSDAVDQINDENCYIKCHKLGVFSTFSDRLFSFRQWCNFLRLRKVVLCKYYWPIAQLSNMDVDDYVYMEQREPPILFNTKQSLADEIIMNIVNKVDEHNKVDVIPKSAFPPTLTPLTTYTNVILEYYKDPELKLLLSEDFTKYSLKYACEKLDLRVTDNADNIVVGVDESGKYVEPAVQGKMVFNEYDISMVYVRNCENKNWLLTNPPTLNHIVKVSEDSSDKENKGYVSTENKNLETDAEISKTNQDFVGNHVDVVKKSELLQEDERVNIFDDDFHNLEEYEEKNDETIIKEELIDADSVEMNHNIDNQDVDPDNLLSKVENFDDNSDNDYMNCNTDDNNSYFFNPETFNREETIRELMLLTCKKYRISIPKEFRVNKEKRIIRTRPRISEPKTKKPRLSNAEVQAKIYNLLSAYREKLGQDVFVNLSKEIGNVVRSLDDTRNNITSTEPLAIEQDNANLDNNITFDQPINFESVVDAGPGEVIESDEGEDRTPNTQADLFDENIYDIKQLYLKVQESSNEDDIDVSDDPEIDKILTKKIDECIKVENKKVVTKKKCKKPKEYDSDDDIPLSVLQEEKHRRLKKQKSMERYKHLEHLIKKRQDIKKFNYWTRYPTDMFRSVAGDTGATRFNSELKENFPKIFTFIVQECAAILDCAPYVLCQSVMQLEQILLSKPSK